MGETELALADYNKAMELDLNDDRYYQKRGWTYYKRGDYERSIRRLYQLYRHAARITPMHISGGAMLITIKRNMTWR